MIYLAWILVAVLFVLVIFALREVRWAERSKRYWEAVETEQDKRDALAAKRFNNAVLNRED
jgi:hypothetical protein